MTRGRSSAARSWRAFHITMRLTVLQQQTKSLQGEPSRQETGAAVSKRLESVKHLLWHGNVAKALERQADLLMELEPIRAHSAAAAKPATGLFATGVHPELRGALSAGETISTAFVESTINQVVSRRFVKKQQMHWTLRGAHLLLQTRTKILNN